MMKRNKITALLYFITSLLFYVSAILNFTSDVGMGVIYLCLGSTSLCFGATWLNKNKTAPQPWQAIAQRFCSIGIYKGEY